MPNKTFAFSNKLDKWATRYSFTPSWYGSVDKHLLSSQADGGSVWEHDVNDTRCSFYGTDYRSKLVVASNQDPSAVKVFNSLSLETNGDKWAANIKTNEEEGTQEGSVGYLDWKEKEGFLYANMPRSSTHSPSSVSYAGKNQMTYSEWLVSHFFTWGYGAFNAAEEGAGVALLNSFVGTTGAFTVDIKINRMSEVPLATGDGCELLFDYPIAPLFESGLQYFGEVDFHSTSDFGSGGVNQLELVGVYGDVLRIRNKNTLGVTWEGPWNWWEYPYGDNSANIFLWVYLISLHCRYPIYVMSPPHINGDNLGGPYAKMELSYDEITPMQVSAINVDYRFSNAEDRLTQNT